MILSLKSENIVQLIHNNCFDYSITNDIVVEAYAFFASLGYESSKIMSCYGIYVIKNANIK